MPIRILLAKKGEAPNYEAAVRAAGAEPVSLYLPRVDTGYDGLILCGGCDVDPRHYHQVKNGAVNIDDARDAAELAVLKAYVEAGKPILGICRGEQLINVFFGGSLIQHMPETGFHREPENPPAVHRVTAESESVLHRLYGPSFWVNSYHHQVVDRLGTGLRPTAFWNDKYVEAFEHTDLPIMAVQWHPEKLFDRDLHPELAAAERALVAKHMQMPNRPQTVSWRLLGYHATYIEMYADVLIAKAKGHDFETRERITRFQDAFGKFEQAIECYYDQANTFRAVSHFNRGTKSIILE